MDQFPSTTFSPSDVKKAGKVISGDVPWADEMPPEIKEAFIIANSWRDSDAFPMRSVRYSVIYCMRAAEIEGISAVRLKRMKAIRAKLRRAVRSSCINFRISRDAALSCRRSPTFES